MNMSHRRKKSVGVREERMIVVPDGFDGGRAFGMSQNLVAMMPVAPNGRDALNRVRLSVKAGVLSIEDVLQTFTPDDCPLCGGMLESAYGPCDMDVHCIECGLVLWELSSVMFDQE